MARKTPGDGWNDVLRNDVVPAEQMMCLRKDVPLRGNGGGAREVILLTIHALFGAIRADLLLFDRVFWYTQARILRGGMPPQIKEAICMKLRKLARQLAAAAVAGAMTLSLCMPALAQTWNISNQPGFNEVTYLTVTGTTGGRTVEMFGGSDSLSHTETDETVLSGSGATFISLNGESVPVVVTLEGLDTKPEVSSPSDACIRTGGDVSVDLRGENTLTIPDRRGIDAEEGSLTLGGTGTLNIRGGSGISVYNIYRSGSGSFTMNGGSVDMAAAEGSTEAMESGIAADTITLNDGSIHISGGEVKADVLCSKEGLTISGGEVTTKDFDVPNPIVLSGRAKVTVEGDLGEGGLGRFDTSGLTTGGYLRYKPNGTPGPDDVVDAEGYVVVRAEPGPQPGGDAGSDSGDAGSASGSDASADVGGALAAVAVGSAALWGGYEIATRVILHNILPEGAAIPANRGQLALLVWNNAGRPEPAAQPAFADVADADMAKAAQWCVEQGIMEAKTAETFKPEGWTPKFKVIETWNKAFPKAK